jgi:fatty acid synthase
VARDVTYAELAPRVVSLPGGRRHLDTRYTRATGRPPVILAGMTPTTVDAPIVAAAANAGYMAELAGGGQPDKRTFALRVEELAGLLEPGREVVFNTLLRTCGSCTSLRTRCCSARGARGRRSRG